jgi:hypothetical protein
LRIARDAGTLVVEFDAAATANLEKFFAAESRCCASMEWT